MQPTLSCRWGAYLDVHSDQICIEPTENMCKIRSIADGDSLHFPVAHPRASISVMAGQIHRMILTGS